MLTLGLVEMDDMRRVVRDGKSTCGFLFTSHHQLGHGMSIATGIIAMSISMLVTMRRLLLPAIVPLLEA